MFGCCIVEWKHFYKLLFFILHILIALQNGRSQFVINGNWKINVPGEYTVAGTKLLYRRSADTWESFEVPGPTQEDLHIMVSIKMTYKKLNLSNLYMILNESLLICL